MHLPAAALLALAAPQADHDRDTPERVDPGRFLTSRHGALELPLPEEEDAFFFVVFGDRTGGPRDGVEVLRAAVDETNLLGPDLVMTVGDMVQGYNERPRWLEEMHEFKGIMDGLAMPWFPVAGNHDVYWRGEGPRPPDEHEDAYEVHFGPLWYAFRHKSAWFVVLYTDEPNPETGERNFNKAECQRMSPEQLAWLEGTLERTQDAEHVFVFCHHPRWTGGNYGDDWEKVHERLVAAGNVKAVFGGHIHHMRYDPRDGIEYFALATVGGHQNATVPEAGYLHCFDVVTVRDDRIDRATIPVGATMDPRTITGEVATEAPKLARWTPDWDAAPTAGVDGAVEGTWSFTLVNPVRRRVDVELRFSSPDPRWSFAPDHAHAMLRPGRPFTFEVRGTRAPGGFDETFRRARVELRSDYLTDAARFAIPARDLPLPLELAAFPAPPVPEEERVLALARGAHAIVPSADIPLPDGPLTVETWLRADDLRGRRGAVCKTESSEYGLFVSDGRPWFGVHLDGRYVEMEGPPGTLVVDRWHHLAGVFDGAELRMYVDGVLLDSTPGSGARTRNSLPFVVGGDVDGAGRATSVFSGELDEVRVSSVARYAGERFEPARRHVADDDTWLLLGMDGRLGPWLHDRSPRGAHAELTEGARLVDAE